MELSNGELRVPRESDAERNYQPARNVLELINVCTSCKEVVEGTEVLAKEIRPVTLKLEVNKDFREWEHYLSKCMRTHGARPRLCGRNTRVPRLARWLASLPGARGAAQGKSKRC